MNRITMKYMVFNNWHCRVRCLALLSVALHALSAAAVTQEQRSHKLKTLKSAPLAVVGKMSDGTKEQAYFKNTLLKPFLRERVADTDGNRRVQKHIKEYMSGLQWTIEEDSFVDSTPYGTKQFTNIIATQNPTARRRLTLACHFDSKYFSDITFIGATDSAVPCAMLLDLARHLQPALAKSCDSQTADISLQFVFFDGEEAFKDWTDTDSLYGARHLAAKMQDKQVELAREVTGSQLETMDVLILLDLIGADNTQFSSWYSNTERLYERMQKIEMRLATAELMEPATNFRSRTSNKYFTSQTYSGNSIQDDHIPFVQRGVPVVHLISHPFPAAWHRASDTEDNLHYPTINNIGKVLRVFVVEYLHLNIAAI